MNQFPPAPEYPIGALRKFAEIFESMGLLLVSKKKFETGSFFILCCDAVGLLITLI